MTKGILAKRITLFFLSLVCILPFSIVLILSLKGTNGGVSFLQYGLALFQRMDFLRAFWNSFFYTFLIIGFNIPISLLAGYALSFYRFSGKNVTLWLYIVLMVMPFQAVVVPQYLTLKAMGILFTPLAVILPNIFFTLGTFLITQYMQTIDRNILEAGRIDGISSFRMFLKIILPMCKPGVFTLGILTFVNYWSMAEQPLLFLKSRSHMPLSVLLGSGYSVLKDISFAGGVIFSILPLLLYILFYDNLASGISLTAFAQKEQHTKGFESTSPTKKYVLRGIFVFLGFMLVCTFITQQAENLMVVDVATVKPKQMEIEIEGKPKETFNSVVPIECIRYENGVPYVFLMRKDAQTGEKNVAMGIRAQIIAQTDDYVAISNSIGAIISYATRDLVSGIAVREIE